MQYLRQTDPRWAKVKIGQSNITVGGYGCVLTSLAMLSTCKGFEPPVMPDKLAAGLTFTPDGLIIWQSIPKKLKFTFGYRYYNFNDKIASDAIHSPQKAVLFQLLKAHWVLALRRLPFGYWWVADPLRGRRLLKSSIITGMTTLTNKL